MYEFQTIAGIYKEIQSKIVNGIHSVDLLKVNKCVTIKGLKKMNEGSIFIEFHFL